MEDTSAAWVTSSGMAAITCSILQCCKAGDHIITSVTTYGGTFAFLKNYLPRLKIEVTFVNITDLDCVRKAIRPNTKVIYTESVTNPLLQVSDIPSLASIAHENGILLMIDNTFCPMMITPARLGADIVVYSMTKFINGKNDCVAGAICGSCDFINSLSNVNDGTAMLLGPVLDPMRSSSIWKNLHTLHVRIKQHSHNAMYIATEMKKLGLMVRYPGLPDHPQHELLNSFLNKEYGYGGMVVLELGSVETANEFMKMMQIDGVGYCAVSLGYFKTLFSNSGKSTSSEVPEELQREIGLSEGLVRFSIGLDNQIERSMDKIHDCLQKLKIIK
jgi:methionine-gamma-lyase